MIHLAGTDFSHLTNDELIKGIQALKLPDYIRSKAYGIDVRETLAQMTEMTIQLGVNMGLSPEDALNWARKLQDIDAQLAQKVGGGKLANLDDLDGDVLGAIEGGEGTSFNLLSIPKDRSVTERKTTFIDISTNLFDKNDIEEGILVGASGQINPAEKDYVSSKNFIKVPKNTDFTSSGINRVLRYDENFNFINNHGIADSGENTWSSTTASYLKFSLFKHHLNNPQVNEGAELLPYEEFYQVLSPKIEVKGLTSVQQEVDNINEKLGGNVTGTFYFAPEELVGYFRTENKTYPKFWSADTMIQAFRDLAQEHPDYITETFQSNDGTGQYPIYKYHLKSKGAYELENSSLPKIILVSGVHGNETNSVLATYYLFKYLCEEWQNNSILEYLRFNIEIVSIPLASPNNYETGEPLMPDGTNLNHDFKNTIPNHVEARNVKKLIDENKDAFHYCDFHTNGSSGSQYVQNIVNVLGKDYTNNRLEVASKHIIEKGWRELATRFGQSASEPNGFILFIEEDKGLSTFYAMREGIDSVVIEAPQKLPTDDGYASNDTVRISIELLVNWLVTVINTYKN